eukprot:2303080-Pyramimonas_sp.AAC.1
MVRKSLVKCIVDTGTALARNKLRVSPKSVVICTRIEDAVSVARAVKLRGFQIQAARQASYLGVVFSSGRRGRAMRVKGDLKHKQMSSKIARFTRASREYQQTSRLEKAGGQPADTDGFQVHGMFAQQVTNCRRRLAQMCASPSKGRCLTTLLDLRAP